MPQCFHQCPRCLCEFFHEIKRDEDPLDAYFKLCPACERKFGVDVVALEEKRLRREAQRLEADDDLEERHDGIARNSAVAR